MSTRTAEQLELPGMPAPAAPPVVVNPDKPTYSFSALETAKCPQKYYLQYLAKTKAREETYQLVAGTLADTAFNAYYEDNQHLTETHAYCMAFARAKTEALVREHPAWSDDAQFPWSKKSGDPRSCPENYLAWLFDVKNKSGKTALELVCRHDRGRVEVQKKVLIELAEFNVVGYIDCFELDPPRVVDVKVVTGWGGVTPIQYALRGQVPLYLMAMKDLYGIEARGAYELILGRKNAELVNVPVQDLEDLQEKLIADFYRLHSLRKASAVAAAPCTVWKKNPDQCVTYNRPCSALAQCWPALAPLVTPETDQE